MQLFNWFFSLKNETNNLKASKISVNAESVIFFSCSSHYLNDFEMGDILKLNHLHSDKSMNKVG